MELRLKPVRRSNLYLAEAMCGQIKYCRIKREPFRSGYQYFLQIVMKGTVPAKIRPGKGTLGLDPGVSTMAVVGAHKAGFYVLAEGVERYEKAIRQAAAKYSRHLRMTNPENFNPDGTVRRDTKTFRKCWIRTGNARKALMELKAAYHKKAAFLKNSHGYLSNRIAESCDTLVKEPVDYRGLARRAKTIALQEKSAVVRKKDGSKVSVHKYKRRKRFGSSIGRRSPAAFVKMLGRKIIRYGGTVMDVDPVTFKASQYNHVDRTYTKPALSERTKTIGGHMVQRDLYSAFLLSNAADPDLPDRGRCAARFPDVLRLQDSILGNMILSGDSTGNFRLKDFLTVHPAPGAA